MCAARCAGFTYDEHPQEISALLLIQVNEKICSVFSIHSKINVHTLEPFRKQTRALERACMRVLASKNKIARSRLCVPRTHAIQADTDTHTDTHTHYFRRGIKTGLLQ